MSRIAFASLVIALSACVTNDGGDPEEGPSITPRVGEWYYADVTRVSSTCGSSIDGEAGNFAIDWSTSSAFHVLPNDGTDPFTCSLSDSAFDCPNRAAGAEDLRPSVDATITFHASAQGSFSTEARAGGSQQAQVSCSGSQCAALGQWPCNYKVNFVIAAN